ncbi:transcription factor HES-7-like isoform X2 [Hyperolius riggenbachi]|uniref:transcription factor HES-7-like isoform X2 n=1 Tax=Hyperolius riggenbachi TaxID=752182 RepID=UPI0035A34274
MPDVECAEAFPSRKVLKPVVEKQRRDRINRSLDEMRVLLLNITGNQKLNNPKAEKAEILELAVAYIGAVIRRQTQGVNPTHHVAHVKSHGPPPLVTPADKLYFSGFRDCLDRTEDFIQDINPSAKARFLNELQSHLHHRLHFPNPLNHHAQVGRQEEDLSSSDGNVSLDSAADGSLCSPAISGTESGSPQSWLCQIPPNPGAYQMENNQVPTYFWRPWP